jgi:DNA invertase Pin-like site-specific DNA recombinase
MKKAFAYLRVSGKGQVDGDGFPRQLAAVRRYAAQHGLSITRVFREEGVSGATELDNRPALRELIHELYSDGVHTVIIEKLDRLARDLMIQETIMADLRKKRIELISVAEPDLDSDDPSRILMRQIFGAIAQYDKAMVVLKLRGARERKRAKEGRCEGRKPYGVRPGEREVITRMHALRKQGMGLDKIATALDKQGMKPRTGAKWYAANVARILARTSKADKQPLHPAHEAAKAVAARRAQSGERNAMHSIIATLRGKGLTLAAIAAALNKDGHRTSRGAKWHPTQVARILA